MNLSQRVSQITDLVAQINGASVNNRETEEQFLLAQLTTLLRVELGAELLTLGKAIGLLEMGNINAATRLLRSRARELR